MRNVHHSAGALLAALLAACAADSPAPGIHVINNAGETFAIQSAAGELEVRTRAGQTWACVGEACAMLTIRSTVCTYGYDLSALYAHDPQLSARLLPVQIERDYTLYALPRGARRPAATLPAAPDARFRPDFVNCPL
jgi:hypothetical protein